jgi:hypothetical protein
MLKSIRFESGLCSAGSHLLQRLLYLEAKMLRSMGAA